MNTSIENEEREPSVYDLDLSENQKQFCQDAEADGLTLSQYSGRFMYGDYCPSVRVRSVHEFSTTASGVHTDNMGLGFVVYCPR